MADLESVATAMFMFGVILTLGMVCVGLLAGLVYIAERHGVLAAAGSVLVFGIVLTLGGLTLDHVDKRRRPNRDEGRFR